MQIVLASKSPRRREILNLMGISDYLVHPAQCDETVPEGLPPSEIVRTISGRKAQAAAAEFSEEAVIIAADTLVFVDGAALGKPKDEADAARMLRLLSGRGHEVYTGVTVMHRGKTLSAHERTEVFFRELTDFEIAAYIATGEPMDKAGAYGAQGIGSVIVKRIDGDFFNVMGLCAAQLYDMLREIGIEILR